MTLIACTINYKVPFITADILMSSKAGKPEMILPTNSFDFIPYLNADSSYKPDSLAQKIYIIVENVCVAVAGNEFEIVEFLRELKARCKLYECVTESVIRNFLDEYNLDEQLKESGFFLVCIEHQLSDFIHVGMFNYPKNIGDFSTNNTGVWKRVENDIYDEVFAFGSGKEGFLNIVSQMGIFKTNHAKGDIWYAIQSNVSLIAKMLAIERTTLHNLKTYWGGGFETAFYNGKQFEKISDIAYVICNGQFDKTGDINLPFPGLFLYYTYKQQALYMVKVEVKKFKRDYQADKIILTAESDNFETSHFIVKGLDADEDVGRIEDNFSFTTQKIAIGYGIITPTNEVFTPSSLNVHEDLTVTYEHQKKLVLILSQEICEVVRASAKKVFEKKWS